MVKSSVLFPSAGGATRAMVARPYSAATYQQQWIYLDRMLVNRHVTRRVVTVQQFDYGEIGLFCRANRGEKLQLWDIEYKLPRDVNNAMDKSEMEARAGK